MRLSDLEINVNTGLFTPNVGTSGRSLVRDQIVQLRRVAVDQMPFQKIFHPVPRWIGGIYVGRDNKTTWFQHVVEYVQEAFTDPVRQIVKDAGAVNQMIFLKMSRRVGLFFENLVNGFLDYFKSCFAAKFALDTLEDFAGVLDRLIIEIKQGETGMIAYLVVAQEFLDFYGRSTTEVKNPRRLLVLRDPARLCGEKLG
jgi:hypothetical protein